MIQTYLENIFKGTERPGVFSSTNIVTPSALRMSDVTDGMSVPNGKPLMLQLLCDRAAVTDAKAVLCAPLGYGALQMVQGFG